MQLSARWMVVLVVFACGGREPARVNPPGPGPVESVADRQLAGAIDRFFPAHMAFRPNAAIDAGLHAYDGRVPDRSAGAIAAEIARLRAELATFEAFDARQLTTAHQLEREIILAEIRKELFELDVRRRPQRDPFYYLRGFSLNPYLAREYAAPEVRAAAMLRACEGGPAYYRQAAETLEPALPRAWLQVGIMMSGGLLDFLAGDARTAFATLADTALRAKLDSCLGTLAASVAELRDSLKARMARGTDDFRIGGPTLIAMLRATDGIDTDLPTLERIAKADLARNLAALAAAARQIDPDRSVADVVATASNDKPAADRVIAEGTEQLAKLRAFITQHQLVSIPREDPIEVRASPSFMRGNFAALGGVGPFETGSLPSFFYLAPPDPKWTAEEQRAYLPSRADLLFVSAHEVFPGHFIQGMHQRASGSRVLQAFETYTSSEGWAHYVEEMLWDQGLGDGDPRVHIGQLKNALLRDVRFLVALGYHAGTLTVEDATKMFAEQAFADPGNARQQALRGTVDPMFLGYTLGKLIIMELRADWQRARPGKPLGAFHDELLRYGEAPLPVTRRMMLGADAGPPLAR